MNQKSTILTAAVAGVVLLVFLATVLIRATDLGDRDGSRIPDIGSAVPEDRPVPNLTPNASVEEGSTNATGRGMFAFSEQVLRMLLKAMAENEDALRKEAVLRFRSDEAYQKFLASIARDGVRLLGASDALRAVRLGFDSYRDLAGLLDTLDGEATSADANYVVSIPAPPGSPESPGPGDGAVPFGRSALEWLGVTGDNSAWGQGVKVAVLDSGIQDHSVFGDRTIREWNMVFDADGNPLPIDPNAGHGTAVGSIIGGADERLLGVAPSAELLSFRILDNAGYTNSFTLAEAIVTAVDAGADVINVSLGSSGNSLLVRDAVAYAQSNDALIVASTGNEGSGQISYPAAIEGVVAVAASDARGEHLDFSNAGDGLATGGLAAPGYEVLAAWPEEKAGGFSGTSASTPYVTGAVAAIMSQNDGMSSQAAYNLLVEHSNEAGAPGADVQYGAGNLNIGRVFESATPGIVDVAVASYYYEPELAVASGTQNNAQVVIENRGTSAVHNVTVEVDSGSGSKTYNLSYLEAGEIQVINTPINVASGNAEGQLAVSASANLNATVSGADRNVADNSLQRVIDFRPQEELELPSPVEAP